jgi:osmotically-inducible protein OsmY
MLDTHALPTPVKENSPARIEAEAQRRLRGSSSYAMRSVVCEYRDGMLVLKGQLPSYYHKQVAQELVQQIQGVKGIENQIGVLDPDSSTWLG